MKSIILRKRVHIIKTLINFIKGTILFILIQCVVFGTFGLSMIFYGPFGNIKDTLVTSFMTTTTLQYIPSIFLTQKEIESIMRRNRINDALRSDEKAIQVWSKATKKSNKKDPDEEFYNMLKKREEDIKLVKIKAEKFKGYMLIIKDPRKIAVKTSTTLGDSGMKLDEIVTSNNALAGINAGGFDGTNGKIKGACPQGVIVQNGKIISGEENKIYSVIGFNKESVLVLGKYTLKEIREKKIRDAVTFQPFLVVNGKGTITSGDGGWGIAPRTAIGQRKDGTILMLAVDGRQVSSFGATLKEVQDILLQYGAYNAASLDGGSSTTMFYEGRIVNNPCGKDGVRAIPSAFVVIK